MVLMMARPTRRSGSANEQFQVRIPADLVDIVRGKPLTFRLPAGPDGGPDLVRTYRGRSPLRVSLGTADRGLATLRQAAALTQFNAMMAAFREGAPEPLSHQQIMGLAGEWYRELLAEHQANPGNPEDWDIWRGQIIDAIEYFDPEGDGRTGPAYSPAAGERHLAGLLDVTAFLSRHGLTLGTADRSRFIWETGRALIQAAGVLERMAAGDYSPDPRAARFPEWSPPRRNVPAAPTGSVKTFADLFARWQNVGDKAPSTIGTWDGYVRRFKTFLGHDEPARVTAADAIRWKDALLAEGRQRIDDSYLAGLKAIYAVSVRDAPVTGITANPFDRVRAMQRRQRAGEGILDYSDQEVARMLGLADGETWPPFRWLPWLLAHTGARINELTQLWGRNIVEVDGVPCIRIAPAPDGGRLKNANSERTLPIHPKLIERGFLRFVETVGDRPLFYAGTGRPAARAQENARRRHASKGTDNRLRDWIRSKGFDDPRKAPCHSFRHWLKTKLNRLGVADSVADAIQGHHEKGAAGAYRHISVAMMLDALKKVRIGQE